MRPVENSGESQRLLARTVTRWLPADMVPWLMRPRRCTLQIAADRGCAALRCSLYGRRKTIRLRFKSGAQHRCRLRWRLRDDRRRHLSRGYSPSPRNNDQPTASLSRKVSTSRAKAFYQFAFRAFKVRLGWASMGVDSHAAGDWSRELRGYDVREMNHQLCKILTKSIVATMQRRWNEIKREYKCSLGTRISVIAVPLNATTTSRKISIFRSS